MSFPDCVGSIRRCCGVMENEPPTTPQGREIRNRKRLDGIRVLIVDDNADARYLTRRIVTDRGAEACDVESAAQAQNAITTFKPQIIVSDLGMPGQNGLELIREIGRKAIRPGICRPSRSRHLPGMKTNALPSGRFSSSLEQTCESQTNSPRSSRRWYLRVGLQPDASRSAKLCKARFLWCRTSRPNTGSRSHRSTRRVREKDTHVHFSPYIQKMAAELFFCPQFFCRQSVSRRAAYIPATGRAWIVIGHRTARCRCAAAAFQPDPLDVAHVGFIEGDACGEFLARFAAVADRDLTGADPSSLRVTSSVMSWSTSAAGKNGIGGGWSR